MFGGFGYFPGDPAHPGQFLPAVGLGQGSCFPSFCAAADLNADGLPDLVAPGTPTQIWFNDPAHPGTFQLQAFSLPVTSRRVVVDDVNGDGSPDIIAATGNGITVFLADPKRPGRFLQQATSSGGEVWPVFADFNGDGIPDMAAEGVTVTLGSYFQTVQFSASRIVWRRATQPRSRLFRRSQRCQCSIRRLTVDPAATNLDHAIRHPSKRSLRDDCDRYR